MCGFLMEISLKTYLEVGRGASQYLNIAYLKVFAIRFDIFLISPLFIRPPCYHRILNIGWWFSNQKQGIQVH